MKRFQILLLFSIIGLKACGTETTVDHVMEEPIEESSSFESTEPLDRDAQQEQNEVPLDDQEEKREADLDLSLYENKEPTQWGEFVEGVKTQMDTEEKVIALTFDACGGPYGNGYDEELMEFLKTEDVPATLFINERWILEHEALFLELANEPLFQIENHGTKHLPLSVRGESAWGIEGTSNPVSVKEEVMGNQRTIQALTGRAPTLFRSGTAFYDDVAVGMVQDLGLEVVNFNVLGDAGATFSADQVYRALMGAKNGSIVLLHMNQPQSGTREGVKKAVMELREEGFEFVTLEGQDLK
ncbi:polysaccharide deacetylase [Halalkalibacter wakoensis JCM 9140]|uniref:Polysaccharide deacetylase n=1 Tax=Halalkalibacter wakoensis JCM 9140 TaxID=1236970 RepID=W4QAG3_9BACI|nr:polysaccharide deacetylase family protein [Halalkalibacter wakoensis]GAE28379.1 polysaccharide deacetylase [Halalkalibacter wakoensis JCM 9140]